MVNNKTLSVIFVANFRFSSTGCPFEFHIAFKHFKYLKNLTLKIWKKKSVISFLMGSCCLKIR